MKASLAPVIVALVLLLSISLLGLVVALWPEERAAAAPVGSHDQAAPPRPGSFEGDFPEPRPRKGPRSRRM